MNYILEIKAFYDLLETSQLSTQDIVLWHALMHIANKTGWQDKFAVAISVLEIKTGLKKKAIYNSRNQLKIKGLIDFETRSGNQSTVYKIISLVALTETQIETQVGTQTGTQVETQVGTQVRTINKLNKTKQNNNNINTVNSVFAQSCKNSSMQTTSNNNLQIVKTSGDINQNDNNDSEIVLTLLLNDKTLHKVTKDDVTNYKELYPATDVICELRKMKGWLESNPNKRKTKRGIKRFITNWLAKEQDKGMYYRKNYNNYAKGDESNGNEQEIRRKNGNDIVQSTIEQGNVLPFTGFN